MRNLSSRMNAAKLSRGYFQNMKGSTGEAQFFSSVQRHTPVRAPSIEADALVPALQCLVVGTGVVLVVTPLAVVAFGLPVGVAVGLTAGGLGAGAMALDAVSAARQSIYAVETFKDNLMAVSGEQSSETVNVERFELVVRREDLNPHFPSTQIREFDISGAAFREFAAAVVDGAGLTQAEWVGSDRPFSRSQFDDMMTKLMELGIIAWRSSRDPAQGRVVTRGGVRALEHLREEGARASTHASTMIDEEAGT